VTPSRSAELQFARGSGRQSLTYAGLLAFTLMLYLRPYELLPIGTFPIVRVVGVLTLLAFVFEQTWRGPISVMPIEFKHLLRLAACMALSIPLALDPGVALDAFVDAFLKAALMFMVIINAVNSLERLRRLLVLTSVCSAIIALGTVLAFAAGERLVQGRAQGWVGGMFGNPNDLALALNMMIPIAISLGMVSRKSLAKLFHFGCAGMMAVAVLVTYSRAGFLTALVLGGFFMLRLGRTSANTAVVMVLGAVVLLVLAPGGYWTRVLTLFESGGGGDTSAAESAATRWELIIHSLSFTFSNPKVLLLGLGMDNYLLVAPHSNANHNSYLQVLTEVGVPALVFYLMFLSAVLTGSGRIARSYEGRRDGRPVWALASGIQGSLLVYAVGTLFASVAYLFYLYYAAGFAVCLRQLVGERAAPGRPPAATTNRPASPRPPPSDGRR
jgi:putative inorganic carbon (hco3(-)) transporter